MKRFFKQTYAVIKDAGAGFSAHQATRMGAALAYYTVFSMGPLLVIAIVIAGLVFGHEAATNQVFHTLKDLVGPSGADVAQKAIAGASKTGSSIWASILGGIVLLFGASGVFGELNTALNNVWNVKVAKAGVWTTIKQRFLSMTMVLGVGFLLLVSLIVTMVLGVVGKWLSNTLPGGEVLWQIINFIISLAVVALLFAALFKYVADIKVKWRYPLIAGVVTSVAFTIGKFAIGLYISKGGVSSAYGAAASLIALLVWVYYSAQIMYFGAELTRALVNVLHAKVEPARTAASASPEVPPVEKVEKKPKQPKHWGPHRPAPRPT